MHSYLRRQLETLLGRPVDDSVLEALDPDLRALIEVVDATYRSRDDGSPGQVGAAPGVDSVDPVEALRISEERYALAVRGSRDGIWDVDLERGVYYASPRSLEILGLDTAKSWGSVADLARLSHPDDRAEVIETVKGHAMDGSPQFEHEWRYQHPDGNVHWVLVRGSAVRTQDGRAVRMAGSLTDVTVRKATEARILRAAHHDGLTGLPNRRGFMEAVERSIGRYHRDGDKQFAILFIDLDRFKAVNDARGHAAGDLVLLMVGRRLLDVAGERDVVARLGGDEFAVLVDRIDSVEDAVDFAERVARQIKLPCELAGDAVAISASVGVAISDPRFYTAEQMLRDADIAMYRAKDAGRDRQILFDQAMYTEVMARIQLESDLRWAAQRKQLRLVYQPIYRLSDIRPVGFEALLRWEHHERGAVSPTEFIPIAEESGQIVALGAWVLDEACRQIIAWDALLPPDGYVTVNLSARELLHPDLPERIRATLSDTGVSPSRLGFEITETSTLQEQEAFERLARLRSLGLRLLMDDFGTGYSSLFNLLRLDIDCIKIDREFVTAEDDRGRKFLKSILTLTQALDTPTVAEGVETEAQLALIRELGADACQGFLLSEPLEVADATALLMGMGASSGTHDDDAAASGRMGRGKTYTHME